MQSVDSFSFQGTTTDEVTVGDTATTNKIASSGERGPNDSFQVITSYVGAEADFPAQPSIEWRGVGGVVYSKVGTEAPWKENPDYFAEPPFVPPIGIIQDIEPSNFSCAANAQGKGACSVHGKVPTVGRPTVDLTVDAGTFRVVSMHLVSTVPQADGTTETVTSDYTLSGYGADTHIDGPAHFVPTQYATYDFTMDGEPADYQAFTEAIASRLRSIGANGMAFYRQGDTFMVRLIGQTFSADRVTGLLTEPGVTEIRLRTCSTSDCSEGSYHDRAIGVTSSDIQSASVGVQPAQPGSPIAVHLSDAGDQALLDAYHHLPDGTQAVAVLYLDGAPTLYAPASQVLGSHTLRMSGSFTSVEDLENVAAIVGSGPLVSNVKLTLANYIPPHEPPATPTPFPTATPTNVGN